MSEADSAPSSGHPREYMLLQLVLGAHALAYADNGDRLCPAGCVCESGNTTATPGCGCGYCRAVFDEWGEQAAGFQRWFDALPAERVREYFGLEVVRS